MLDVGKIIIYPTNTIFILICSALKNTYWNDWTTFPLGPSSKPFIMACIASKLLSFARALKTLDYGMAWKVNSQSKLLWSALCQCLTCFQHWHLNIDVECAMCHSFNIEVVDILEISNYFVAAHQLCSYRPIVEKFFVGYVVKPIVKFFNPLFQFLCHLPWSSRQV